MQGRIDRQTGVVFVRLTPSDSSYDRLVAMIRGEPATGAAARVQESKDASGHEHDPKTGQFGKGSFVPKHQGGEGFAKKESGGEHSQIDLDDMGKGELLAVAAKHGIEDTAGLGSAALRAHLKSMLHEDQNPPTDTTPATAPAVDAKTVQHHLATVKQLWDEAGDVKNFPAGKIRAAMEELGKLPIGEVSEVAKGFGIEKPEKTRPKVVQQIEKKITATYRAHVANRV